VGFKSKAAEAALMPSGVTHAEVEVEEWCPQRLRNQLNEFVHVLINKCALRQIVYELRCDIAVRDITGKLTRET